TPLDVAVGGAQGDQRSAAGGVRAVGIGHHTAAAAGRGHRPVHRAGHDVDRTYGAGGAGRAEGAGVERVADDAGRQGQERDVGGEQLPRETSVGGVQRTHPLAAVHDNKVVGGRVGGGAHALHRRTLPGHLPVGAV